MQTNDSLNIHQNDAKVQPKSADNSAVAFTHKAIIKVKPEAVLEQIEENLLARRLEDGKPIMWKELQEYVSFRAVMEADGHKLQASGTQMKCCCPFHPDHTPSFFILEDDTHAKCYGCGWYGNIYKYEQEFNQIEFKEAWLRLNDFIRQCPRTGRKAKAAPKKEKTEVFQFTDRKLKDRKKYTDRLATETWLAKEVCFRRHCKSGESWDPSVIRKLAAEGSLGWGGDCLAFLYANGTKYRQWPAGKIEWQGGELSLWRGHLLENATHVYLTESETDAIALLHTGVEEKKPGCVVIAAPGAMSFNLEWAPLFKDKVVTFCFDSDDAGENGVKRATPMLVPFASQLRYFDLKEVK